MSKVTYFDQSLYNEVQASTNIISGDEYRKLFCTIAKVVSDMVSQTLGPYGATTIIDDGSGFTYPTKDGWSCMNRLRFNDPIYNTIFGIIKQVSFNSVSTVGDGTTTAMVATNYFLQYMYETIIPDLIDSGMYSQADLIDTVTTVTNNIIKNLLKNPNVVNIDKNGDYSDIRKIAYIATNGNDKFADIIQKNYQETQNPNIRIDIDNSAAETFFEVERGYRFDCRVLGYPSYINDEAKIIRKDSAPFNVIIFDHNITYNMHKTIIGGISNYAAATNKDILILAPYFDDIVASIIDGQVGQMVRQGQYPNIMLAQIPTSLNMHQQAIQDIAVLTNALVFTESMAKVFNILAINQTATSEEDKIEDSIMTLPQFAKYTSPTDILVDALGTIKSAVFTRSEGFIQDYDQYCNAAKYENLVREVKDSYEALKIKASKTINGFLDKDFLFTQMRYIKLLGNSGVIKVGGISDIQRRCDKDALDDAVLACRSAYENGYVRGMGLEILKVINETLRCDCKYITSSVLYAIRYSFEKTFETIVNNKHSGTSSWEVSLPNTHEKELKGATAIMKYCTYADYGYDLRAEKLTEKKDWTVINSVQTDIEILNAMTSILTTIMTSSQFLSMNKAGDMKVSHDEALRQRAEDEMTISNAKAKGFIKAFNMTEDPKGASVLASLSYYPVSSLGDIPEDDDENRDEEICDYDQSNED